MNPRHRRREPFAFIVLVTAEIAIRSIEMEPPTSDREDACAAIYERAVDCLEEASDEGDTEPACARDLPELEARAEALCCGE